MNCTSVTRHLCRYINVFSARHLTPELRLAGASLPRRKLPRDKPLDYRQILLFGGLLDSSPVLNVKPWQLRHLRNDGRRSIVRWRLRREVHRAGATARE